MTEIFVTGYTTQEIRDALISIIERADENKLDELCRVFADPDDPYLRKPASARKTLPLIFLATPSNEQIQEAARILISEFLYQAEDGLWYFAGEEDE